MLNRAWVGAALAMAIAAGCASPTSPLPTPEATPSRPLARLLDRLAFEHPDPWYGIAEAEFFDLAEALTRRIGTLPPERQLTEVMRLVAMVARAGRNGHMVALPDNGAAAHRLPLGFYRFMDGLFIVEAAGPHQGLVGAEVHSIGGVEIGSALERLRPLVSRDNRHTVDWVLPLLIEHPAVLAGVGLSDDPRRAAFGIARADGTRETVDIAAEPTAAYPSLLEAFVSLRLPPRPGLIWLRDQDVEFRVEPLSDAALYVQYNTIWQETGTYVDALRRALARSGARRLILDLRLNPGGEIPNYAPLLGALQEFEQDGRELVVLIGRATFSAATALAVEIAERTDATFLGEPSAGSPTTYASVRPVRLRDLQAPMVVFMPTEASSVGPPEADTVEPDLTVLLRSADYLGGDDPVLDAALALPPT